MSTVQGLQPVPGQVSSNLPQWVLQIARTVNSILQGKLNATKSVTLTANATSTTLTDSRIGNTSVIILVPTTAHAATAMASVYIDTKLQGTAVIHHPSSANADQTFDVLIITG